MKSRVFLWSLLTLTSSFLILFPSCECSEIQIGGDDPLTPEENLEFLEELSNLKRQRSTNDPEDTDSKQAVDLKMSKLSQWANAECGNLLLDPFAAFDYEEVRQCNKMLDTANDDMSMTMTKEVLTKFCEEDSQDEFKKCVTAPLQTYGFKMLRCLTAAHPKFNWEKSTGQAMLLIQHGVMITLPKFLNLSADVSCRWSLKLLEMLPYARTMDIDLMRRIGQRPQRLNKSRDAMMEGMELCWIQNNPITKPETTLCEQLTNYKPLFGCFLQMKEFENPVSQIFWNAMTLVFDFVMEKDMKKVGPMTLKLRQTVFEEFCSSSSPLYNVFTRGLPKDDNMNNKDEL